VVDEMLNAHVNSLLSTHLIDVVSTDKHTVKPWFSGHSDVSPLVADFEPQGYKLVGGRVDYLEHQRAAVVVYRHGAHVINVFSWAATQRSLPGKVTRNVQATRWADRAAIDRCCDAADEWQAACRSGRRSPSADKGALHVRIH
jgi:anti-sigma factor RsiW